MTALDHVWRLCDHFDAMATLTRQNEVAGGVAATTHRQADHLKGRCRQMDHTAAPLRPDGDDRG